MYNLWLNMSIYGGFMYYGLKYNSEALQSNTFFIQAGEINGDL